MISAEGVVSDLNATKTVLIFISKGGIAEEERLLQHALVNEDSC